MQREESDSNYLLQIMSIGELMLKSGAEVSRVENAVRRMCRAAGATRTDVFSITSSIVATVHWQDGTSCTETRRIIGTENNMARLDRLNDLSRRICNERLNCGEIEQQLTEIKKIGRYSNRIRLAAYALVSGAFSCFFKGNLRDILLSSVIGLLLGITECIMNRRKTGIALKILMISLLGGILSNLAVKAGLADHADLISYGNIMLFIPGIAFTNSLRDLFTGDTITGSIRLLESLIMATVIAIGFTFARRIF